MADKDEKSNGGNRRNMVKQIIALFKFTYKEDRMLPWLVAGAFLAPIVVAIVLGIVFHWSVIAWILLMITAVMLGALFFTMVLTNRADRVGYAKLEGQPGAAIGVLGNISRAGYTFPQEPVWVDPKTKDMIWRGTSNSGIYLLGEGDEQRINRAMDREERKIKGVTAGSSIPVYRICVGTGEHQVRLKDLRRAVLKCKSYEPTHHKLWIAKKLHPRSRFYLTKTELNTLNERLRTLQLKQGYGVPKGIDPTRTQHISRRALRGR